MPLTEKQVDRAVETWRERLVPEWKAEVNWATPAKDGNNAQIWTPADYLDAEIRLSAGWRDLPAEKLERTLVHELLHLALRDLHHVAIRQRPSAGPAADEMAETAFDHEAEGLVDRLARSIVPLAPVLG